MALGSIVIDLLLKTGAFTTDAKQAEKRLQELQKTAISAGKAIGAGIAAGATVAAVALKDSINTMDEMSKSAQKVGITTEEFSKLNYAAGLADVSMETLVGSLGKLTKAQAEALKSTSQQAKIFDALGIAVKGSDGNLRESTEVLADFADRFQQLEGSPEAMAAGFAIFGRSFQNMIPLLKDGGDGIREAGEELEAFGGVLSTEAGNNAEAFNDNLSRLSVAAKSLAQAVATDLLPDLVTLTERFVTLAKDGHSVREMAIQVGEAFRLVANVADIFVTAFKTAGTVLAVFGAQAHGVALILKGDFRAGMELYKAATEGGEETLRDLYSDTPAPARTGSGGSGESTGGRRGRKVNIRDPDAATDDYTRKLQGVLDGSAGTADKAAKDAERRAREAERSAQEVAAAIADMQAAEVEWQRELSESGNPILDEYASRLDEVKDSAIDFAERGVPAEAIAEFTQRMEELATSIRDSDVAKYLREFQEETDAMAAALGGSATEGAYRFQQAIKALNEELAAGLITQDAYNQRLQVLRDMKDAPARGLLADLEFENQLLAMGNVERATAVQLRGMDSEAIQKYGEDIRRLNQEQMDLLDQVDIMDGMRDSFQGFTQDVIEGNQSIGDSFKDLFANIASMVAQRAAENWVDQLFGAAGTTQTGTAGGWLSTFAGLFTKKAAGGYISGPGTATSDSIPALLSNGEYVIKAAAVGEYGKEFFDSLNARRFAGGGYVGSPNIRTTTTSSTKRPVQQVFNTQIQGRMDRTTEEQFHRRQGREAARAMARTGR